MPGEAYSSIASGPLRLEYGSFRVSSPPLDYATLLCTVTAPLHIWYADQQLLEFDEDFPILPFALALGRWSCPHAYWLYQEYPGLRERMEHDPAGLDSSDFAWLDAAGELLLALRAQTSELVLPLSDKAALQNIDSGIALADLQQLGVELLQGLAGQLARHCGWSLAPLISRNWQSQLQTELRVGSAVQLDVRTLLSWKERPLRVQFGDWQLEFALLEPHSDAGSLEELPALLTGSLSITQRISRYIRQRELPLLEFAITALDWVTDPLHPALRLHRPPQGNDAAAWAGYELGSPRDGSLQLGLRRRGDEYELLGSSMRARGPAIGEQELRGLLLAFGTALIGEIHERTGWCALPLFTGADPRQALARPKQLPKFDLAKMIQKRPGSRILDTGNKNDGSAVEQSGPVLPQPGAVIANDPLLPRRGELRLDFELLDFAAEPQCPADVQEQLLATISLRLGERELLKSETGLPLLDFCINCLVWLCRHDSVSAQAGRERDPRRRGRAQDFILAYDWPQPLRLGFREDYAGYLLLLEFDNGGSPQPQDTMLTRNELWQLMFELGDALRREIHRRWGWDVSVLFGPDSYRWRERRLLTTESLGYFKLEREIPQLADLRDGVVKGPPGCLRI
jgi:hypothetical protein